MLGNWSVLKGRTIFIAVTVIISWQSSTRVHHRVIPGTLITKFVIKTIIRLSTSFKTAYMSYITTYKIGIRLVIGRIYHISIEIFRRYRWFPNVLGSPHMQVFCMRGTSMGNIRKRSSVSPQTKDVNVGIMLKHTDIILKYLHRDKRNRDVHPENGFINCNVREGGWVQLVLLVKYLTDLTFFMWLSHGQSSSNFDNFQRVQCT